MVLQATIDMLVGMKMTAMAAELSSQLQDTSFSELSFEDQLGLLVTAEWNRRQTNTVKRLIHNAHFAAPSAAVEEISYYEDKKLGKAQLPDCPFNPSDSPCELKTDLIILREAERESMEIFYAMREELHFYLKCTQLLESILTANGILIPEDDD